MPRLYVGAPKGWRAFRWFLAAMMLALIYAAWRGGTLNHIALLGQPLLWWALIGMNPGVSASAWVLADGILATGGLGSQPQYIPLSVAEAKHGRFWWTFRWKEGRRERHIRRRLPRALKAEVPAAIAAARVAEAGTFPTTATDAAARLRLAFLGSDLGWVTAWVIVVFGLLGLTMWLRNPLPLIPLALAMPLLPVGETRLVLALTAHTLWVMPRATEPHPITLTQIIDVLTRKNGEVRVLTADPAFPEFKLNNAWHGDFTRALQRKLSGEPTPTPAAPAPVSAEPPLRCTLCGRPEPTGAARAGVYICDSCANRARHEATEAGHGMSGKDPKPM